MHLRVPLRHIPHSLDRQRFRHFAKAIVWLGGGKQMLKLSWWLVALQLSSSYYHVCTLIKASCSQLPRALTAQHSSTTTIWNKILQASSDTGFAKIMLHVAPLHNWNTKNRSNFSGSTQSLSVASIRGRRQPQHHEMITGDLRSSAFIIGPGALSFGSMKFKWHSEIHTFYVLFDVCNGILMYHIWFTCVFLIQML